MHRGYSLLQSIHIFEENLVRSNALGWKFHIIEFKRGDPDNKFRLTSLLLKPEDEFALVTEVYLPRGDERNNWCMSEKHHVRIVLDQGPYQGVYSVHHYFFDDFDEQGHARQGRAAPVTPANIDE